MLSTPEEKSALLNWALEGLKRLMVNGEISNRPSVEAIRTEYRKRSLTTLAYFDSCVTVTDDRIDYVFTDDWFRHYVSYCHDKKLKPTSKGKFVEDVEKYLSGVKKTKIRKQPKTSPLSAWRYVKIKEFVPNVPDVPPSENISTQQKILPENNRGGNTVSEHGTDGTNGTNEKVAGSHTQKNPVDTDGYFTTCFICRKSISNKNELTNVDGKPCHTFCKQQFEDQKKKGTSPQSTEGL